MQLPLGFMRESQLDHTKWGAGADHRLTDTEWKEWLASHRLRQ